MISNPQLCITILAGGNGTRMNNKISVKDYLPKVLHIVANEPMLVKLINACKKFNPEKIIIVVNPQTIDVIKETLRQYLSNKVCSNLLFTIQEVPQGTGHAVLKSLEFLSICKTLGARHNMILNGDTPCLKYLTLIDAYINFLSKYKNGTSNLQITSIYLDNPAANGRIVNNNQTIRIVEYKDCTEEQKNIKQINAGIYIADIDLLLTCIPKINNKNKQGEYYLTDIVNLSNNHGYNTILYELDASKQLEIFNVNTRDDLNYINKNN